MRSYGQYCALARGLDVIGDRWALLVVRELLHGPQRYGELLDGLPGIATNLLAERLRQLEDAGVVSRHADGVRYRLTPWGEGLRDVVYALGRWAAPLMREPRGEDEFRSHWLSHMVVALFEGVDPQRGELVVEIDLGDRPMTLLSAAGRVHLAEGRTSTAPDIRLAGPPDGVVGLIAGRISHRDAARLGVEVWGDAHRLVSLRPLVDSARAAAAGPKPRARAHGDGAAAGSATR